MNKLQFDFIVNKENNTIEVTREFAAPLERVWAAWTQSEILDQWWAPKPYAARTKSMDFSVGGTWIYAMVGPDGSEQWCKADYKSIEAMKNYSALDAFCDEEGNVAQDFPRSLWTNSFNDQSTSTIVNIVVKYEKIEDLQMIMEMGFEEGFTACMENLDAWLAS